MEMFLLAIAIVVLSVLFFKGIKIFNYIDHVAGIMEMIPGPTPYPFVGNLFQFGLKPDEYPKKILQYCRKYDFQGFRSLVFFQYHVMLSDPAEIQNMLSSSALLYKEHLYSFLRPWLGDGLLTSSGARWLKHQKLYMPAFDGPAIDGYMQVVHKTGNKFVEKLQDYAAKDEMFDIQELIRKCTLDIVCENATGIPSKSLDNQPSEMQKAIIDLCDVIQERTFSIVKRFDTLFYLTPYYGKQRRALSSLKTEINRIVEQQRRQLQATTTSNSNTAATSTHLKPFLNVLLKAKLDGRVLKTGEIFEEISTFIFTGHDPTAAALSFTLYTLSRHPEIQQKAYEEQKEIFKGKSLAGYKTCEATLQQLEQMSYLELVLRETLRLYPSVPLIARTNRKAIDINGTQICKRTTVIMCLIAMGYNEKYFEDPCKFKPERFANISKDENIGIEAFKSVPFSAGPRRCIAEKFATYQLKALLSLILRNYEILPAQDGLPPGINDHSRKDCVPESEFDPILNIRVTLKSENGILVRLKKRN
ncbi:putative cytochrome P450 4ad1 [Lucilia cuprina]|uniref:Putative cytochrome P450 4ad1 n=1 Tax=Lucilia cuprina TaxID=7375 RepID=A0A0L0CMR7_LUCCU|nr:putative cytochrome P450 4ad1 [Lucilia cuprina]KNC33643.1 putative cytochrome P450 4ad1 [Lucilia cuprina]